MRFELTRAEPIGLAVQRLNHSATSSRGPGERGRGAIFVLWAKWWVSRRAARVSMATESVGSCGALWVEGMQKLPRWTVFQVLRAGYW